MDHRITAFAAFMLAGPVAADFDPTAYPAYETCALCHDLFGNSVRDKFPKLAGQKPVYLETQIRSFLSGVRTNDGGQMAAIVTELAAADIAVVVDWFASQDPPPPAALPPGNSGKAMVERLGCASCHGQKDMPHVPYLTAQHSAYLFKQMRDYKEGRRDQPDIASMHQESLMIPETDIKEIADYFAAQERQDD